MKIKILSLVLIAILAVSSVSSISAIDVGTGIFYADGDSSTLNGRFIDIKAYDVNNTLIATHYNQGKWNNSGKNLCVLPDSTSYIIVDVAVWKVNSALKDGHWNHVFSNKLSRDDLNIYLNGTGSKTKFTGKRIITQGTMYGSSAKIESFTTSSPKIHIADVS
ncbi:MAG: hypothetical protein LBT10_04250 [Methanobrevibacter sp.]|nr:hypothetical protein [Methanobrevibacter sp.]